MSRTRVTPNKVKRHSPMVSEDGAFPNGVDSDPDNGHVVTWSPGLLLYVTSDADEPTSISVHVQKRVDTLAVADLVVWIPPGEGALIGPFSRDYILGRDLHFDVSGDPGDVAIVAVAS